jgi:hypothetical protein
MDFDVEEVDLASLAAALQGALGDSPLEGYVRGRTVLRDAVAEHLGCSEAEAERLVETMVGRGFLRFEGDPASAEAGGARWTIGGA